MFRGEMTGIIRKLYNYKISILRLQQRRYGPSRVYTENLSPVVKSPEEVVTDLRQEERVKILQEEGQADC